MCPRLRFFLFAALWMALQPALSCGRLLSAEPQVGLWILSGQSNACGRATLPGPQPHPSVSMFDPSLDKFVPAKDPLPHMGTVGVGPWVAAARTVAIESESPIRMCGFASGGKPIAYWHPGQPGYRGLFGTIETAGKAAGVFLWYQGESDAAGRLTMAQYRRELRDHVARVRQAAESPHLLAVIVQLGPSLAGGRGGFMAIREAQRQFVIHDAHALLVPALGRSLKDSVHLDNAGYRELGREIGRAVLRAQYGTSKDGWPGPVLDAAVLKPAVQRRGRRTVVAHFAEAQQLKGVAARDFAVIDAEGTNRCIESQAGQRLVTLTCEKDIVLPARLVYGFGQHPQALLTDEAGNRAPAVQLPVSLGVLPTDTVTGAPRGAG